MAVLQAIPYVLPNALDDQFCWFVCFNFYAIVRYFAKLNSATIMSFVGLGGSFCFNANSAILTLYFERFKYIAFSLSMLGAYLGVVAWPLLSQYLLSRFGYSYAMGIISTLTLINIIAGILFVEPQTEEVLGK